MQFSSPIGESTFSTHLWYNISAVRKTVFVPYRGIYFLYEKICLTLIRLKLFSSPIGESTFSTRRRKTWLEHVLKVFVPYRGIYFLYVPLLASMQESYSFSSPIGESTFSTLWGNSLCSRWSVLSFCFFLPFSFVDFTISVFSPFVNTLF